MVDELGKNEVKTEDKTRLEIDAQKATSVTINIALAVLCIIAALVSLWDIEITLQMAFTLGWMTVMLYLVANIVYTTKYNEGQVKGKRTEEYQKAVTIFKSYQQRIIDESLLDKLGDWCLKYRRDELMQARLSIISGYVSVADYTDKYSRLEPMEIDKLELSESVKKLIKKANAIKPVDLNAGMLMGMERKHSIFIRRAILPVSAGAKKKQDFWTSYVTRFLMTVLSGMIAVQVIKSPTLETFLRWIVRMLPIVSAYCMGDVNGFRNITETAVKRMEGQNRMLEMFFTDLSKEKA